MAVYVLTVSYGDDQDLDYVTHTDILGVYRTVDGARAAFSPDAVEDVDYDGSSVFTFEGDDRITRSIQGYEARNRWEYRITPFELQG